jgi:hypothetical protein
MAGTKNEGFQRIWELFFAHGNVLKERLKEKLALRLSRWFYGRIILLI